MSALRSRLLLAAFALSACGDDDNVDCRAVADAGAPPASTLVVSLSAGQRAQICDLAACENGGYGVQRSCPSGPAVTFAPSRDKCLADTPTNPECRATVGDLMGCLAAIRASPCVSTFLGSSACEAVTQFECLTFRPQSASVGTTATARRFLDRRIPVF